MTRIFIDSSVFIAAAISQTGHAWGIVETGILRPELITLYCSQYVLLETERNLEEKRPQALYDFRRIRENLPNVVQYLV